jgi:EmrB/QacA subfamily drug resistance transporter
MTAPVATPPVAKEKLDPALWRMTVVLLFGAVLGMLDATIVNVGIGPVARSLHSPLSTVQWVSTGYLLAVSMVMPLSGWAMERFGGKAVWMTSVALFVGCSALCGLAWSAPALIVFRVLQGIGGGMMQPVGQTMLAQRAGKNMARLMSLASVPVMLAPVIGPVLGGLIVQDLDWRWLFYVNLPIGLAPLVAAAYILPRDERIVAGNRLDWRGFVLLSPGLAAVVYGFSEAGNDGFGSARVAGFLAAGAALLVGYGLYALKGGGVPLIDLRLFTRRGFSVATANSFLMGASLFSSMLLVPLYYQQVKHASALSSGLLLAPQAVGTVIATVAAGRVNDRFSPRAFMLTGLTLAILGTFAFTRVAAEPAGWLLTGSLVLRGFGMGLTMTQSMVAVYGSVERHQVPRASSAMNVLNRIGGSLGTAILVVVLQDGLRHDPTHQAAAFGTTFWWVLGLSLLSLIPAALFPRHH